MFHQIVLIALLTMNGLAQEPPPSPEAPTEAAENPTPEATPPTEATPAGEAPPSENAEPSEGSAAPEAATEGTAAPEAAAETTPKEPATQPATAAPPPAPETEATEGHSAGSHFTVEEMWSQSSGPVRAVLLTLLLMLIWAMGIGLERLFTLSKAQKQSLALAPEVTKFLSKGEGDVAGALKVSQEPEYSKSYLAHLLSAALVEFNVREDKYGIEAVERALEKYAIKENAGLRKGLNVLATVGSTAPFVGLVGTIFGIINAFSQIGAEGGADLTTLAPAIGEALITTAFGIIVAIVGVWLFNYFTARIESINNDMAESAQELLDWCHKRIIPDIKAAK